MSRKIGEILTVIIIMVTGMYLILAAGHWQLYPGAWDGVVRGAAATLLFALFVTMVFVAMVGGPKPQPKRGAVQACSPSDWQRKIPVIEAYARGQNVEFNTGSVGNHDGDQWEPVEERCSFDWPASYYRVADASAESSP